MAKSYEMLNPEDIIIIGLDTKDGEEHPLHDERVDLELDEGLVCNVMLIGVRQAITVREEAGKCYVIDGRQRVRAAREANRRLKAEGEPEMKVKATTECDDDKGVMGVSVALNEHRQNDPVMVKVRKAARLLKFNLTVEEIAVQMNKSTTTIRNYLALAEADPAVHKAIKEGKLTPTGGIEIAAKPRGEQADLVDALERQVQREAVAGVANASTPPPKVTETTVQAALPRKVQPGVKRSWIKKALKTEAAKDLSDDNREVLEWFAFGKEEDGAWFVDFAEEVTTELAD